MTEIATSSSHPTLPWRSFLRDTFTFIKASNIALVGFLGCFFTLSFLGQYNGLDWDQVTPFRMWASVTGALLLFAVSYFFFVAFVLWTRSRLDPSKKMTFGQIGRSTSSLLLPLTILSIRGTLLFLFGLFLLILPGIYYSFKYELASFCLILEGWKNESPPILRAEQIITRYRFSLFVLAFLMLFEWLAPLILEGSLRLFGFQPSFALKAGVAAFDTTITVIVNVYCTLVVLHLTKEVQPSLD